MPGSQRGGVGGEDDVITMLHSTIGGRDNGFSDYDEGRTLVHEIGHYLGLFHTFQASGTCSGNTYSSGDLIVDTPDQRSPDSNSSSTACGATSALDNFMNYSYDDLMYTFTPEQTNRMICSLQNYRPSLFAVEATSISVTGPGSPLVVSGLTNGTPYDCSVGSNQREWNLTGITVFARDPGRTSIHGYSKRNCGWRNSAIFSTGNRIRLNGQFCVEPSKWLSGNRADRRYLWRKLSGGYLHH